MQQLLFFVDESVARNRKRRGRQDHQYRARQNQSSKVMPCSERPRLPHKNLRMLQTLADYGWTCSVASPVTSARGFCCESLALTCTMDKFEAPGAIAFTTIPMIVPVPLTPAVFGCRVAEIIACPCLSF